MTTTSFKVTYSGFIQLLEITDGKYYRRTIQPGDDLSKETPAVRSEAEKIHTPAFVATFRYNRFKDELEHIDLLTAESRAAADSDPTDEILEAKAAKMEVISAGIVSELAAVKAAMDKAG